MQFEGNILQVRFWLANEDGYSYTNVSNIIHIVDSSHFSFLCLVSSLFWIPPRAPGTRYTTSPECVEASTEKQHQKPHQRQPDRYPHLRLPFRFIDPLLREGEQHYIEDEREHRHGGCEAIDEGAAAD